MSTYGSTSLFYSLTVRAADAAVAGRTYSTTEPAIRTVQLIALRREQTTLIPEVI